MKNTKLIIGIVAGLVVLASVILIVLLVGAGDSHDHKFGEWKTVEEATCSAEGSKERYCECGEKQTASIYMLKHSFGELKVVKEASTEEKGVEERSCSCGEKETKDIAKLSVRTEVSAEEWKKALDLSRYESLTITGTEAGSEDGIDFDFDATITYYAGLISVEFEGPSFYGDDYFITYEATTLDTYYPLQLLSFRELQYMLTEYEEDEGYVYFDDYGYSNFTYSETDKSYRAVKYGCIYALYFENGKLVKYSYEDNGQGEFLRGSFVFSKVNSTPKFSLPIEDIRAEYISFVNSIPETTRFYYYNDDYDKVYCDASYMKDLLLSQTIELVEGYEKGLLDGNINNFYLETETMSSEDDPIMIDVRDGKIYEIKIGRYYADSTYYYTDN